jgi:hypothetical protein
MRNIIVTKSLESFEKLGTPSIRLESSISDRSYKFPKNLDFNTTYYKLLDGKLTAFRILAYAACYNPYSRQVLSYLVQLPSKDAEWIYEFIEEGTPIFRSKEDFIQHQISSRNVNLGWTIGRVVFPELAYAAVITARGRVWKWSETIGKPTNEFHANMKYFVVNEGGVYIGLQKNDDYYLSVQDCISAKLNNMEVEDFADEPFSLTIDVLPSDKVVHTLRFVED